MENSNEMFNNPISGEMIKLAVKDFSEVMTYEDAVSACKNLGDGWRLPSIYEWEVIHKAFTEKTMHIDLNLAPYWSSSQYATSSNHYTFNTENGRKIYRSIGHFASVRAVKTISSN